MICRNTARLNSGRECVISKATARRSMPKKKPKAIPRAGCITKGITSITGSIGLTGTSNVKAYFAWKCRSGMSQRWSATGSQRVRRIRKRSTQTLRRSSISFRAATSSSCIRIPQRCFSSIWNGLDISGSTRHSRKSSRICGARRPFKVF